MYISVQLNRYELMGFIADSCIIVLLIVVASAQIPTSYGYGELCATAGEAPATPPYVCTSTLLASFLGLSSSSPPHPFRLSRSIPHTNTERMVGAHVQLVSKEEYRHFGSETLGKMLKEKLVHEGRSPYVVPVGGSNSLGSWGYVEAIKEIEEQVKEKAKGLGYAMSTSAELKVVKEVAETTGVVLDPVYSGKALIGLLIKDIKEKPEDWIGRKVLFVHTGGLLDYSDRSKLKRVLST